VSAGGSPEVSLTVTGRPQPCGEQIEKNILRIGQEAISNAVRHADATHVTVALSYEAASLSLRVSDNGRGFDPEAAQAKPPHWGLRSMHERIEQLGGQWKLTSAPGAGTDVLLTIPLADTPS
jgi:signal transduction histidine kinase